MRPNDGEQSLAFPLAYLGVLAGLGVEPVIAYHVLESDEQGSYIREIALSTCNLGN